MKKPSQTQQAIGLTNEIADLVGRIHRLCERRAGTSVLISAPHNRGSSALWQKAVAEAKKRSLKPTVMSIDLSDPPQGATEMIAMVQQPEFLSEKGAKAAISLIKMLADGAGQVPMDWVLKLILKMVGVLPELVQQIEAALQHDKESPCDFSFSLLRQILTTAARQPLILVLEDVESASTVSADCAVTEIVDLVRHGLPILLVVTYDETRLPSESKLLLEKRVAVGDAALWELPQPTDADFCAITGPITAAVLRELRELAGEDVDAFLELWGECQRFGLVCQSAGGEWTWVSEAETELLGKFAEGAFQTLKRMVERTVEEVGDEKLVRLALGIASLQPNEFSDEVVANVLWRLGLRRGEHYAGKDSHLDRVIDLLDERFDGVVEDAGFDVAKRPLHRFRSALLHHFCRGDIPPESRAQLFALTASALEQIYRSEQSQVAWLVIDLYRHAGQEDRADRCRDYFVTPRSPVAQTWELTRLSERIRALHSDTAWAAWVQDVAARLEYVPGLHGQVLQLLDEAIIAMLTVGDTETRAGIMLCKANLQCDWAQCQEAIEAAGDALNVVGEKSLLAARCLSIQATALHYLGRFSEAEPLMRRALAIDETGYSPEHPRVAIDLNNLAQLLKATNRLKQAEPLMRRALAIDETSYGPEHPNVAIRLNNLAQLLQDTNRLGEAEPLMRRALAIDETSYGPEHPDVAIRLNNLAQLLKATNRLGEAEPLARRALAIDETSYGPEHPNVARDLNNLAALLKATNRLGEAEPLMRRALAIDVTSYGPEHPKVAIRLNNLALLLKDTNRLGEAEPLMRRALAIDETSYGPEHPKVATDLNNLAQLLQDTNRLGEAEPLMRRALAIDETSYGPEHPHVAGDLNNLALLLKATNRLREAEPLMRRVVIIFRKFRESTGYEHPGMQTVIRNYAALLEAMKLSAEEIQRRVREAAGKYAADESTPGLYPDSP